MQESEGHDGSVRDHDYFETTDGWIFLVLGDVHPAGRVWSLLKYVPGNGIWGNGEKKFIRVIRQYTVSELLKIINFVEERQPGYVFHDPTVGAKVIAPPISSITRVYSSKRRLKELLSRPTNNRLERLLVSLVERLTEVSGVPIDHFGVTGSILPAIHHQDSDIDLVVYGTDNLWRVLEALKELHREGEVALLGGSDPEGWVIRASSRYPVSTHDLRRLASNVINKGVFSGVPFSVHGVREAPVYKYGEVVYSTLGMAKVRGRVVDVRESLFTPAVYFVEDEGGSIDRIVCYDMMLAGVLREGDLVEAYGKLEVARRNGEEAWRQILIGSYEGAGREYIRIL
jgi:predicted nucleotidyltransferase